MGHFAKCCKSKDVKFVLKETDDGSSDDDSCKLVGQLRSYILRALGGNGPLIAACVKGARCKMLIDSGADENLIDEATFDSWWPKPELRPTKVKMYAYEGREPLGCWAKWTH